jgi:dienelactone hydrolase
MIIPNASPWNRTVPFRFDVSVLTVGVFFLLTAAIIVSGCARKFPVRSFSGKHGFTEEIFSGGTFDLKWFWRGQGDVLRVYIEGDGKAWLSRSRPSSDPTPDDAAAFRLAAADTGPAVMYLARPCQFVDGEQARNCIVPFWTSARFAEPVIQDASQALDAAKRLTGARRLELVGYSGGGAVAVLLAARRDDVDLIVTVAGNLNHALWTDMHGVSPLLDSLNPVDVACRVQSIRQVHIVSVDDEVIPPAVVESYVRAMTDTSMVRIVTVKGVEHDSDWREAFAAVFADQEPDK